MDNFTLHEIDEGLMKNEVDALKFLCLDFITKKRQENITDAKDLFQCLKEQNLLSKQLLRNLLAIIGRWDLLRILGITKEQFTESQEDSEVNVSPYRKMLYELSEDVIEETLHSVKFILSDLPKTKLESTTFLDILVEMEKMERLGLDNLDELESILNKCAKKLARKIQNFKNTRITESTFMPRPAEPTCNSPPCQEKTYRNSFTLSTEETDPISSLFAHELNLSADSNGRLSTEDTSASCEFYPMTHRPLGYCLIINNFNYKDRTSLNNRKGTDIDKDALTRVFQRMHFVVEERRDLTKSRMKAVFDEFARKDHSTMDAFVCCILSHGERGAVLGIDGKTLSLQNVFKHFGPVRTLAGKPKLFFIQACQGSDHQDGVLMHDGPKEENNYDTDTSLVPLYADMLIGLATVEYYVSYRHTLHGSIYIQELCSQLEINCPKKDDILSILTKVNASVSRLVFNGHKQMPQPRYTLTKKLLLPMD